MEELDYSGYDPSSYITNIPEGQDWYTMAAQSYNDNPLAARGGEGGPAYIPNTVQPVAPQQGVYNPATGGYDVGSLESRVAADQAAVQQMLNPRQQGAFQTQGLGTPIPSGSRATSYGTPNVAAMGQPYAGGAASYLTNAGYKPPGTMPTTLMDQYTKFLTDPQSGLSSPIFQAILGQGQQAAERGLLARGGNASGQMPFELQKAAIASTGAYLPTMADILKGGAQTESGRYGVQTNAQQGAGQIGLGQYGAEAGSQLNNARANYGIGQDTQANLQGQIAQQPINQLMTMMLQRQMQGY